MFDHFNKTNIQIGDKAFYTLKEADIDLNKCPPDKEERIDLAQCSKVQPENKKSKHSSACKDQGREDVSLLLMSTGTGFCRYFPRT